MANGRGSAMHAFVLVLNAHLSASHSLWPDERSSIPDDGIEPGQFLNAHRRSRMIMAAPLAALWETIGHCGTPPEDDSRTFALVALVLTGLVWFALPAVLAIMLLLT